MGRLTVKVPDVGEGVAEVELVSWAVAEGQPVERNQIVAEVMTDKATVEVPSPVDGVMGALAATAGDRLLVGEPLFQLQVEGEGDDEVEAEVETASAPEPAAAPSPTAVTPAAASSTAVSSTAVSSTAVSSNTASSNAVGAPPAPATVPAPASGSPMWAVASPGGGPPRPEGRRPTAAPSVRRRARDAGVDLRSVVGSGPAGRITHEDLDEFFRRPAGRRSPGGGARSVAAPNTAVDEQPVVGLRRRIAEQMVASASTIPHITYVDEVDMTALEELRSTLNARQPATRLTILPFLVAALVKVLPRFPMCNAHLIDNGSVDGTGDGPAILRTFGGVHVGIATQTDGGLVVPVLRHAEAETLSGLAARLAEGAEAARTGRATAADLSGSTITITSLGALGGLVTTPVINKPETSIVGVNKMTVRPVWIDGQFVPRKMMNLSSSFDHRVIDGWDAARFVQAIKQVLEQPALLFVDQPPTNVGEERS